MPWKLIFLEQAKKFSEDSLSSPQQHPVFKKIMSQLNPVHNLTLFLRFWLMNLPSKKIY
jgi:hypothetical protein